MALHNSEVFRCSAVSCAMLHSVAGAGQVHGLAVAPDGGFAVAGNASGQLVVVHAADQRVSILPPSPRGAGIRRVAVDPATGRIVSVHDDGYLRVWSLPDGVRRGEIRVGAGIAYDVSVENGRAVTAAGSTVVLVDVAEGTVVRRYRGHHAAVTTAQLRAGGRWFVTGDASGKVLLWQVDHDRPHAELAGHSDGVLDAVFAEDGTIYTCSHDGTVRFWRPPYDEPVEELQRELTSKGARR